MTYRLCKLDYNASSGNENIPESHYMINEQASSKTALLKLWDVTLNGGGA